MRVYLIRNSSYYGEVYAVLETLQDVEEHIKKLISKDNPHRDIEIMVELWDTEVCKSFDTPTEPKGDVIDKITIEGHRFNITKINRQYYSWFAK